MRTELELHGHVRHATDERDPLVHEAWCPEDPTHAFRTSFLVIRCEPNRWVEAIHWPKVTEAVTCLGCLGRKDD